MTPSPMVIDSYEPEIGELKAIASAIANRGWCPATGGNFSVKLAHDRYAITASGIDKTTLQIDDFLIIDRQGQVISGTKKPSAETLLHTALYGLASDIGAVLHVHTIADTVLSIYFDEQDFISFQGYEMQKALTGVTTHEMIVRLNILNNNQNMSKLAQCLQERWQTEKFIGGLLVRGHGLYAWGKNLSEAKRHLEGLEFLLSCELQKKLIEH